MANLKFRIKSLRKSLGILASFDTKIRLVDFSYRLDADSTQTVIIKYKFENAVWYEIEGRRSFDKRHVLLRPETGEQKLLLKVKGVFSSKNYVIVIKPEHIQILGIAKITYLKDNASLYNHCTLSANY